MGGEKQTTGLERRVASERVVLIRRHHTLAGTDQHWGRDRFNRLCRLLGCVPEELAELVCVPSQRVEEWLNKKGIPPWVALHFVLLERAWFEAKYTGLAPNGPPVLPIQFLQKAAKVAEAEWVAKHD